MYMQVDEVIWRDFSFFEKIAITQFLAIFTRCFVTLKSKLQWNFDMLLLLYYENKSIYIKLLVGKS